MNPDETRRDNIKKGIAYGAKGYVATIYAAPDLLLGYEIGCHDRQLDRVNSRIDDLLGRVTNLEKPRGVPPLGHPGRLRYITAQALRPEDV